MIRYLASRAMQAVIVLVAAYTLGFLILYALPSDPAAIMAAGGEGESIDPAELARFRAELGLDRPVIVQYGESLWAALRGDLGTSISTGRPVTEMIAESIGPTAVLAGTTLAVSVVAGVVLALPALSPRRSRIRELLLSLPGLGLSVPTFVTGLVLLQIFSFRLGWLPAFGASGATSLVLPVIALAIPAAALIAQLLAKGIVAEERKDYTTVLIARGASRPRIFFAHLLRNACLPALTAAALLVGDLLAGSIVVETVFSRPGLGRIAITAVVARDLPVVLGIVACGAAVFVVVNVVVDLFYPVLDPTIVRHRDRRR
ncbi:ABC transporter permease [Microbacterium betulae]|uniref:ABC transporter permease n=1 Tax=Microbacterium betulae TaxID=2981139 RepID=A0AA97I6D2_9MICO|nr:ABC transporter permease [Microbacterium sp. AB]WOF22350.1 ABC transporter permease [Microbacterium sp. AB]